MVNTRELVLILRPRANKPQGPVSITPSAEASRG